MLRDENRDAKLSAIAGRLLAAYDAAAMLDPITVAEPDFTVAEAYVVLGEIERHRRAQGWQAVGRKTTGTLTDAWPVGPGETWASDYGTLGIVGLTVTFA